VPPCLPLLPVGRELVRDTFSPRCGAPHVRAPDANSAAIDFEHEVRRGVIGELEAPIRSVRELSGECIARTCAGMIR
jgi:hypothetical protein